MSSMKDIAAFLTNLTAGKSISQATLRVPEVDKDILESLFITLPFSVNLLEFRATKMVGKFELKLSSTLYD